MKTLQTEMYLDKSFNFLWDRESRLRGEYLSLMQSTDDLPIVGRDIKKRKKVDIRSNFLIKSRKFREV